MLRALLTYWFMSFLEKLQRLTKDDLIVGGVISGTSQDSIVAAICRISQNTVSLIGYHEIDYSSKCKSLLNHCLKLSTQEISELNFLIGQEFSDCMVSAVQRFGFSPDLVGFHGQTVFHHSGISSVKSTLQLGVPEFVAEALDCFVVSDFRYRDIVLGGEGAPLSPWGDYRMFNLGYPFVVLNLGGVANFTYIDPTTHTILGFDAGPGNSLLDRTVRRFKLSELGYDKFGEIGKKGKVIDEILEFLLRVDDYFQVEPPKSCGFERFGDSFLDLVLSKFDIKDPVDFLRTVYEYTVIGITSGLKFIPDVEMIILAGGGCQNHFLVDLIKSKSLKKVKISDEFGIPWKARESILLAILAYDFIKGTPTNLPSVTGAKKAALLGRLIFP